jgi:hypothetical protein
VKSCAACSYSTMDTVLSILVCTHHSAIYKSDLPVSGGGSPKDANHSCTHMRSYRGSCGIEAIHYSRS